MKESGRSLLAPPGVSRYATQLGMVALLVAELLYLTVSFDTQSLDETHSIWGRLIGWAPQCLRLAITIVATTALLAGRDLLRAIRESSPRPARDSRLPDLAVHGGALLLFIWLTGRIVSGEFSSFAHPALWASAWFLAGAAALVAWGLAVLPAHAWFEAAAARRRSLFWGLVVGTAVWAGGFLTEELWTPLARYTFAVVEWMLRFIYPATVSDASQLMVGTPTFKVVISPQCSGYEGIGLILAFLSVYLWLFRKDLRFPGALALLPIGAATIWIVNAVRIVALVVIGTSGWAEIAKGGFHSQAGWLAFNAVALGFVAIMSRGRYFRTEVEPLAVADDGEHDQTPAYLGPFVAIMATAMLTGALSAGFEWLYPVRVFAAGVVLWMFRKSYANLKWSFSWWAASIGFVTFLVWLALTPAAANDKTGWPASLQSVPFLWAAAWLVVRVVGYVVAVPLAEELAFRGFLTRRIVREDFQNVPLGLFSWSSFLISSVLFGAFHGGLWLAGTIAGMSFALAMYRRRSFGDAVQAHAITNGLLALYAFATGNWSVWS